MLAHAYVHCILVYVHSVQCIRSPSVYIALPGALAVPGTLILYMYTLINCTSSTALMVNLPKLFVWDFL